MISGDPEVFNQRIYFCITGMQCVTVVMTGFGAVRILSHMYPLSSPVGWLNHWGHLVVKVSCLNMRPE